MYISQHFTKSFSTTRTKPRERREEKEKKEEEKRGGRELEESRSSHCKAISS